MEIASRVWARSIWSWGSFGMSSPGLFTAVRLGTARRASGGNNIDFTAVDFETTALHPGRIIEIGAVRINGDGSTLAELSTLVNPGKGVNPGATWVHRITREQLDNAPSIGDVLGDLLELCRDSVLVAHNLPFEEKFLAHELQRHGIRLRGIPGLCTLAASRTTLRLPNYKLGTVVHALGLDAVATHAALDDARACARLAATLVNHHGLTLATTPRFVNLPKLSTSGRLTPRASGLRAGERGWMANLMQRLPATSLYPIDPALEAAYLDLLTESLADGKITGPEATALAEQARGAGMSAADVRRVHLGVLTALRQVAEEDGIITPAETRHLHKAAAALGVPEALTDLPTTTSPAKTNTKRTATTPTTSITRVLVLGSSPEADQARAWVVNHGAQLAKKLTASVTHLAVDITDAETSRVARARELGVHIVTLDELKHRLTAVSHTSMPPAAPHTVTTSAPAMASTEHATPASIPVAPQPAQVSTPPPGTTITASPRRATIKQWTGRTLIGLGTFLAIIGLLAAPGGAPLTSVLVTILLGAAVAAAGYRMTPRQ